VHIVEVSSVVEDCLVFLYELIEFDDVFLTTFHLHIQIITKSNLSLFHCHLWYYEWYQLWTTEWLHYQWNTSFEWQSKEAWIKSHKNYLNQTIDGILPLHYSIPIENEDGLGCHKHNLLINIEFGAIIVDHLWEDCFFLLLIVWEQNILNFLIEPYVVFFPEVEIVKVFLIWSHPYECLISAYERLSLS